MTKVVAYYGGTRIERNRFVFRRTLQKHAYPALDFMYVVRNRPRKRQLEKKYLEKYPSSFEIPIFTFRELVNHLINFCEHRSTLSETASLFLVKEIIESQDPLLTGSPITGNRHIRRIFQEISSLKQKNILEPELMNFSKSKNLDGSLTKELVWCFSRYQTKLEELGMEDWSGRVALVYQGLLTGKIQFEEEFCELRSLILEGFSDLLPLEHAFFRLLRSKVNEIVVSSDFLPPPNTPNKSSNFSEMHNFLGGRSVEWRSFKSLRCEIEPKVVCLPTIEDEAFWISERVKSLLIDSQNVVLISTNPESYRQYLTRELLKKRLNLTEGVEQSLGTGMILDLVKMYLKVVVEDFPRKWLFDLLHHPRFNAGFSSGDLYRLEKWANICGVQKGFKDWTIKFPKTIKSIRSDLMHKAPDSQIDLYSLVKNFSSLIYQLKPDIKEGSLLDWWSCLEHQLSPFCNTFSSVDICVEKKGNKRFQTIIREINQFQDYFKKAIPVYQFTNILEFFTDPIEQKFDLDPSAIIFARPEEIAHLEVDVLIWMGLSESKFASELSSPVNTLLRPTASEIWENQLENRKNNFVWIRGQASRSVIYTYPENISGDLTLPSLQLQGLNSETKNFRKDISVSDLNAQQNIQRGREAVQMRERAEASAFDGIIFSKKQISGIRKKLGGRTVSITPTLVEEYMRCGFRFLAENYLGLKQESKLMELRGATFGGVIHRLLYRFMSGLKSPSLRGLSSWNRLASHRLLAFLEQELEGLPYRKLLSEDLIWSVQEHFLRSGLQPDDPLRGILKNFLAHQEKWLRHNQVEALGEKLKSISLGKIKIGSGNNVEIILHGTVDRIDRNAKGLIAIDYKSGKVPLDRLYRGWGFQLPFYYFLVKNHYKEKVDNVFFFKLGSPETVGLSTVSFPNQKRRDWELLVGYYQERALEAMQSLLSGKFPVTLVGSAQAECSRCGFRDICRRDSGKIGSLRNSGLFPVARSVISNGTWAIPHSKERDGSGA